MVGRRERHREKMKGTKYAVSSPQIKLGWDEKVFLRMEQLHSQRLVEAQTMLVYNDC